MNRNVAGASAAGAVVAVLVAGVAVAMTAADDEQDPTRIEVVESTGLTTASTRSNGPTTMVVVTPAPTTAPAPTTTTVLSSTVPPSVAPTPPTTVAPAPGRLEVAVTELDLGADQVEGAIEIANSGGRPLVWTTTSDHPLVQASAGGALEPGGRFPIVVAVSRAGLIEGDYLAYVSVLGEGRGAPVTVRWRVERAPVVRVSVAPPGLQDGATCTGGKATTTGEVSVAVIDESDVASAELTWAGPGPPGAGPAGTAAMVPSGPGRWQAPLGPLAGAGTWTLMVWATDARGNVGTGSTTLVVTPCPTATTATTATTTPTSSSTSSTPTTSA